MLLDRIYVGGLYGTFNHSIKFRNQERMTIIIGENGLGKTIILKMLKLFFDQDFIELKSIYFERFSLFFNDETEIKILRITTEDGNDLSIECLRNDQAIEQPFLYRRQTQREYYRKGRRFYPEYQQNLFDDDFNPPNELDYLIEKYIGPTVKRVGPGIWLDRKRGIELTSYEIYDRYREVFPRDVIERFQTPGWLKKYTDSSRARMVETQRLLRRITSEDGKYKSAVLEHSQEIIDRIKTLRAAASDIASRLDRTYPKRLLEKMSVQEDITSDQLTKSLQDLEEKRTLLNTVGLIDAEEQYIQPYVEFYEQMIIKNVLILYINDSNEKLNIYNDSARRISLFLDIINKRFLYKTFRIDKNTGFVFQSTVSGKEIPVTSLSSGEQHELVLFYQLLFNTQVDSLLLIDEPEISLHISWQNKFLDDLREVIKINHMDIVIATHSPDIIGKYWELTTQIKGPNDADE